MERSERFAAGAGAELQLRELVRHLSDGELHGLLSGEVDAVFDPHTATPLLLRSAQEALRRREQEFRALVEHTPDVIVRYDRQLRHIYANPAMERATGLPPESFLGRTPAELRMPAALVALWERTLRTVFDSGEELEIEFAYPAPGEERFFHSRVVPEFASDGSVEYVLGIWRDITERRRAAEALRESEERFRQSQKMEAVGRLAGGVAHDFNNLLTAILGNAQLLLTEAPADSPARQDLEEICRAGERAAALTRQLLAFSRRQVLEPRVLDLGAVVAETGKMLRRLVGEDIEIYTYSEPSLGPVRADPNQIEQVLLNLVVNARDAMPHGGRLTIETANEMSGSEGASVVLRVRDTGEGMSEEVRERIFDPFFTTKPQGKGTGLGLATVYGIVAQSGGRVRVDSAPGLGTTFEVVLPRVDEDVEAAPPSRTASTQPPQSGTILVVEDEPAVLAIVRRTLERAGYNVLCAASGQEALQVLERRAVPLDLVLTDVVMPGMSGLALMEQASLLQPELPCLYMSGYSAEAFADRGDLPDGIALLNKPFTPAELTDRVRAVLAAASQRAS